MICVIQRVAGASVTVDDRRVGAIDAGLLALVGVLVGDDDDDVAWIADRLRHLRIFADDQGRMNLSIEDVGGSLLLVSQFTLAADTRRGRRPSFSRAAEPQRARELFDRLVQRLRSLDMTVRTGEFGASMQVRSVNDGPVTIVVDSAQRRGTLKGGA